MFVQVKIMQKVFKTLAFIILGALLCFSSVSCGEKTKEPSSGSDLITAITAKEESVNLKIGESLLLTNYYEIESSTKLSAINEAPPTNPPSTLGCAI